MALAEHIVGAIGPSDLDQLRHHHLDRLADEIFSHHWHVNELSWSSLPLLPMPPDVRGRRLRSYVEFGKRVTRVQLAGERVAVAACSRLLAFAQANDVHAAAQRAIAAVLNDESSHAAVMTELAVRVDAVFPDGERRSTNEGPLFPAFLSAMPDLAPPLIAMFMGAYEAMVAVRSYNEEAEYAWSSILGEIAERSGQDDGRHAKVMRLVSCELIEAARATKAPFDEGSWRSITLDPIRRFWPLLIEHEWFLVCGDARRSRTFATNAEEDAMLGRRFFEASGLRSDELDYVDIEGLTRETAARCVKSASLNSSGLSTIGE